MKTALILYEPGQLGSLEALIAREKGSEVEILSLDAQIDYELERRKVSFVSGKNFQDRLESHAFMRAEYLAQAVCDTQELSFLKFHDISLLSPVRFSVQLYAMSLLNFTGIVTRYVDARRPDKLVVLPPATAVFSSTSGYFAEDEAYALVHAAWRVAEAKGVTFEDAQNMDASIRFGNKLGKASFHAKRSLFAAALMAVNFLQSLRPRRSLVIVASDYWRNISPVLQKLPDAEVLLIDRSEAMKAGLRNIWRHKMRFVHAEHYLTSRSKKEVDAFSRQALARWRASKEGVWKNIDFVFEGIELRPTFERVLDKLIESVLSGQGLAAEIAGTEKLYAAHRPHAVWVRASVSLQTHFSIMPLVARSLSIPSIEPQHGIEYLGPGSATPHHAAEYIAVYGKLVRDEHISRGHDPERLLATGSPRFDSYAQFTPPRAPAQTGWTVLTTVPGINAVERFGSFSIEEHFAALGKALSLAPDARLTVTSRNVDREAFMHEAMRRGLSGAKYKFAGAEPLVKLFAHADAFVCSFSTVVYEALLCGKPTILVAFAPLEKMMSEFHFSKFEEAGALRIARTPEELARHISMLADPAERERMGAAGRRFMDEQFSFDGKSSERIAGFIRTQV